MINFRKYIGAVAYPPGSIYCTTKDVDPSKIWGGIWEKLEGKFLFASDSSHTLGSMGGEEEHILSTAEMPTHQGHIRGLTSEAGSGKYLPTSSLATYGSATRGWISPSPGEWLPDTSTTGGNAPHNNMPPYQTVNMWIRKTLRGGLKHTICFLICSPIIHIERRCCHG